MDEVGWSLLDGLLGQIFGCCLVDWIWFIRFAGASSCLLGQVYMVGFAGWGLLGGFVGIVQLCGV